MNNTIPITRPEPTWEQWAEYFKERGCEDVNILYAYLAELDCGTPFCDMPPSERTRIFLNATGKPEHIIYDEVMKC